MTVVKEPVRIHVGVPKPNLAPSITFTPRPVEVETRETVPVGPKKQEGQG